MLLLLLQQVVSQLVIGSLLAIAFNAYKSSKKYKINFNMDWRKYEFVHETILQLKCKMGIQQDIQVVITQNKFIPIQAHVDFMTRKSFIIIDEFFLEIVDEKSLEFLLAHELIHIKEDDVLRLISCYVLVSTLFTIPIGYCFPNTLEMFSGLGMLLTATTCWASFLSCFPAFICLCQYSKIREKNADVTGFKNCGDSGKLGAIVFFKFMKDRSIPTDEDSLFQRWAFSSSGDFYLDVFHPSLQARIDYLLDLLF